MLSYFKNIVHKDIKPLMYQKFINYLSDSECSKRTVKIIHGTMYNALEKVVNLGKIQRNPCAE
ncbi:phage integrase SAM-like domain-containing protein [Cytobacillus purgationiresistens]|uniref:phage integrase SAM-like domain-containing protein n=1 Tax=Cytobacillus purgationiresistens TaxID=863449 RepID=UPI003520ED31